MNQIFENYFVTMTSISNIYLSISLSYSFAYTCLSNVLFDLVRDPSFLYLYLTATIFVYFPHFVCI